MAKKRFINRNSVVVYGKEVEKKRPKKPRKVKESMGLEKAIKSMVIRQCSFKACQRTFKCLPHSKQKVCSHSCISATNEEMRKFLMDIENNRVKKRPVDMAKIDASIKDGARLTMSKWSTDESRRVDILRIEEE